MPEDGFSGLDIKVKQVENKSLFSLQITLRELFKQFIVTEEIIAPDEISKNGFLKLRFRPLIFSRGSEFELVIRAQNSIQQKCLELILIEPKVNTPNRPTIYNISVLEGHLPVKLHFTTPSVLWRLLLKNTYILLILTTLLSLLIFRVLPEKYRYPWAIIYFSVVLMLPTYVIISPDEEGFYNSLLDAILKSRTLAEGNFPFWNSFHGIGMAYNTMSSVNWHPIWLLLDKVSLSAVIPILYHIHVLTALFSMYALARLIELRKPTAFLCSLTYTCSTQAITYIFGPNFWPAGLIPITLMPLILFFLIKFLHAEEWRKRFLYTFLTGACVGFMILNTHLGMILFLFIGLSFYLAMNWRRLIANSSSSSAFL